MRKILFLDIDGVLNNHNYNELSKSCTFDKIPIYWFNKVIKTFSPEIIISSAWRYLILNRDMTIEGFKIMLRTHGFDKDINIIGCTDYDMPQDLLSNESGIEARKRQIRSHLGKLNLCENDKWIVLDDLDLGIAEEIYSYNGLIIKTNSKKGFTHNHFRKISKFYATNN